MMGGMEVTWRLKQGENNGIVVRTEPKKTKVSETFMSENFQIEKPCFFGRM